MQRAEERKVDVELLVARAVERAHRRLADPAGRAHLPSNSTSVGRPILRARLLEDAAPHLLGAAEHLGHELPLLVRRARPSAPAASAARRRRPAARPGSRFPDRSRGNRRRPRRRFRRCRGRRRPYPCRGGPPRCDLRAGARASCEPSCNECAAAAWQLLVPGMETSAPPDRTDLASEEDFLRQIAIGRSVRKDLRRPVNDSAVSSWSVISSTFPTLPSLAKSIPLKTRPLAARNCSFLLSPSA